MAPDVLSVQNLRVQYGELRAVDNISFSLEPGDACALIGPNGAGKTSTMRSITGLQRFDGGEIRIAGVREDEDESAYRRAFGYMPDYSPLWEELTCREFLDHYAHAYELPNASGRIDEVLDMVGLVEKADARCGGLSRGMKQRLIFARTVLPAPPLLILDEPASGLDPLSRRQLRQAIARLRDQGITVLISSHILGELAEICNTLAVIERGQLRTFGPVEELVRGLRSHTWLVRWRTTERDALPTLEGAPNVIINESRAGEAIITLAGAEEQLDELLTELIRAGVRISHWAPKSDHLETILLALGATDVH